MKLVTVDSSKGKVIDTINGANCLNFNALVKNNYDTYNLSMNLRCFNEYINSIQSINLNNLASLCYKLRVEYGSDECLDIVRNVKNVLRDINKSIVFQQLNIDSYFEIDLEPYNNYYFKDIKSDTLYIIKPLKDILKFLGYTETQLISLIENDKFIKMLPPDLMKFITIENNESEKSFIKIKEIIWSTDI